METSRFRRCGATALVVLLAACTAEPYFIQPDRVGVGAPIEEGVTLYIGVAYLDARPGDSVELVSVETVGLDGRFVTQLAARVRDFPDASVGTMRETDGPLGRQLRDLLRPMAGFTFTDTDGTVEVVLALVSDEPMILEFSDVRLFFRVNGGMPREQLIPFGAHVCIATPEPDECSAP